MPTTSPGPRKRAVVSIAPAASSVRVTANVTAAFARSAVAAVAVIARAKPRRAHGRNTRSDIGCDLVPADDGRAGSSAGPGRDSVGVRHAGSRSGLRAGGGVDEHVRRVGGGDL